MLPAASDYDDLRARFRWNVPARYNIGVDICDKWSVHEAQRPAIVEVDERGDARTHTFGTLRERSNRLANLLAAHGVARGDRVAILLPQSLETALGHIAAHKLGAISIPLFVLFGDEALQFRLADAGAKIVLTDRAGAAKIAALKTSLPALDLVISIDGGPDALDFHARIGAYSADFKPVDTAADDPAIIIYTSGTTGSPKGALHAHRVLLGHLPGVEMSHDLFPRPGDKIWTPADWAWIGGLIDVMMPALHHGVPLVARRFQKFTGEAAFDLMAEHDIRNAFLPPTALKTMRAVPDAERRWRLSLRTVASGGESLGAELIEWGRRVLGVTINEFYGQTECNMTVSSSARLGVSRAGVMGKPVPGHDVAVIDAQGRPCSIDEQGAIAVRAPDPVMFLGYWNNPIATKAKFVGDWLITGDTGVVEADGSLRFVGRDDDVITSSGYRIGPGEIEDCLLKHPSVAMACVVGKPDPQRTEIVKAYVVLKEGTAPSAALEAELAAHVKTRLAAHEYPREVTFVDTLPLTTTGKIIRREMRARAAAEEI